MERDRQRFLCLLIAGEDIGDGEGGGAEQVKEQYEAEFGKYADWALENKPGVGAHGRAPTKKKNG